MYGWIDRIEMCFTKIHLPCYRCDCGEIYIKKEVVKRIIKNQSESMERTEPLWVIANTLKLSKKQLYRLIKIGELNAIKKKGRWFIYMDYKLKRLCDKYVEEGKI